MKVKNKTCGNLCIFVSNNDRLDVNTCAFEFNLFITSFLFWLLMLTQTIEKLAVLIDFIKYFDFIVIIIIIQLNIGNY